MEKTRKHADKIKQKLAILWFTEAVKWARKREKHIAKGFAKASIAKLQEIDTNTLQSCLTNKLYVRNIPVPEILHEDVVRDRMRLYGIIVDK